VTDTKTLDKLDSLLRMYFNSATTDGEKSNALQLFKKISIKNGIDPDEYIKTSAGNPVNKRSGRFNRPNSRTGSRPNSHTSSRPNSGFDANDFWDSVFRNARQKQQRDDANNYRRKYEQAEKQERERKEREAEARRREEERKRQEAKRQQDQTRRWGTLEFEMKEPLWEVKFHKEKRVILLNTMVRGKGTQNRWGTQNFCIYSDTFDPEKWFTLKAKDSTTADKIYIVQSGKVQYFRDHYIMEKLFIIDSAGFEVEIPLK